MNTTQTAPWVRAKEEIIHEGYRFILLWWDHDVKPRHQRGYQTVEILLDLGEGIRHHQKSHIGDHLTEVPESILNMMIDRYAD